MRADEIPVGWIGCVPHMRPPPPGGGCGVCVAGGTGKEQQKAIIRHSAALATSYIEYIECISIPDSGHRLTWACVPAAAADKLPAKRKATSVDRPVRLKNNQHGRTGRRDSSGLSADFAQD